MPIQNLGLTFGTYMYEGDINFQGYGQGSPRIGHYLDYWEERFQYRPIFKFNADGFSGQILSASFNFYCDKTGGSDADFTIHKVNKAVTTGASWYSAGSNAWSIMGCSATEEDRTADTFRASQGFTTIGWASFEITNLTLLNTWLASQRAIVLINAQSPTDYASIALSPAPYLAVEYKTSLIGGIQIF